MASSSSIITSGEDRIIKLPDCIQSQILSFLPTIDAVRTFVLSKGWIHQWTYVTHLNFDYDYFRRRRLSSNNLIMSSLSLTTKNNKRTSKINHIQSCANIPNQRIRNKDYFKIFVSQVLIHLATPTIQSFSLNVDGADRSSLLEAWFHVIAKCRVKNLIISLNYNLFYDPKHELFSSFFSICDLSSSIVSPLHHLVKLSELQTLELSGIAFKAEEEQSCDTKSEHIISLSFPVLKKFKAVDISFMNMKSNLEASARITFPDYGQFRESSVSIEACNALKQLNMIQVKHLQLTFINNVDLFGESFGDLPIFTRLSHLNLSKVNGQMLITFLLKTPFLTSLTIEMANEAEYGRVEKLLKFGIVPDYCIHNLKAFKIDRFWGYEGEISLAKHIMENASDLEHLSFSIPFVSMSKKRVEVVKDMIYSFKKGVNLTSIDFIVD